MSRTIRQAISGFHACNLHKINKLTFNMAKMFSVHPFLDEAEVRQNF